MTYAVGAALAGEHRAGAPEHEPADYDRALGAGEQVAHHDGGVPRRAHTRLRPGPDELEARHGPARPLGEDGPHDGLETGTDEGGVPDEIRPCVAQAGGLDGRRRQGDGELPARHELQERLELGERERRHGRSPKNAISAGSPIVGRTSARSR